MRFACLDSFCDRKEALFLSHEMSTEMLLVELDDVARLPVRIMGPEPQEGFLSLLQANG